MFESLFRSLTKTAFKLEKLNIGLRILCAWIEVMGIGSEEVLTLITQQKVGPRCHYPRDLLVIESSPRCN